MKKLIVFVVALVMTTSVFAQEKPIRLGVFLGPNFSWLSPDMEGVKSNGTSMGFAWGLMTDFTLMENYYLTTGININYFRGKLAPEQGGDNLEMVYNMRYLMVPLTLKLRTNELLPRFKFYGSLGLEAGVRIRAKGDMPKLSMNEAGVVTITQDKKVDIKDYTQPVIGNLIIGAGAEFAVDEALDIVAGLSFHNGLLNALKQPKDMKGDKPKALPYYFSIDLAVLF